MTDEVLLTCNNTELLCLARVQGLPPLRKNLPTETLARIVAGDLPVKPEHVAGTDYTRASLEKYIQNNFSVIRSQLPGCNGQCTTYPCSEGRHALCFAPNRDVVQ
jgi:hypothetical protein